MNYSGFLIAGILMDSDSVTMLEFRRQRRRIRDTSNPLDMNTNLFMSNFRLTKEAFVDVLQKIEQRLGPGSRQNGVPNILKLAITLRFCAQGSYQLGVGNEGMFGLAQPTVSLVLAETLNAMENTLCPEFIKFDYADADAAKLHFFNKCGIPGVIGAIDGTHIRIVSPSKTIQHLYYNRKGFHSINAMIVCDHNMRIRYISAKYPGSSHDSLVFNTSSLKAHLESSYRNELRNSWLLGDAGYALLPYLMTPYRSADEGSMESNFNTHHAKGRNIVERVIGVLKNRWRCILGARALHYAPEKATQIINVCAALHNICCTYNISFDEPMEINSVQNVEETTNDVNNQPNEAEAIRNEIARSLIN